VKEAQTASKNIGDGAGKIVKIITVLAPGAVTWGAGQYANLRPSKSILYSAAVTGAWIGLLMMEAAYKKHKAQEDKIKELEDATDVKLKIERIAYQHDISKGDLCRVTVRNISKSKIAENVHVRMCGDVIPGAFVEGYSPFNEPDLVPSSGSRSINPNAESDWLFSDPFNQLVSHICNSINVVEVLELGKLVRKSYAPPNQIFSIEASAAFSPPITVHFEIARGANGKVDFKKCTPTQVKT